MASLRKRGRVWYIRYVDSEGRKVERKGATDKRVTEQLAAAVEAEVAKIRAGIIDEKSIRTSSQGNRSQPVA